MSSVPYTPTGAVQPTIAVPRASLFSQAGIGMFLLGVASGIPVQTVGRLFVGELVLMAISPVVAILLLGLTDRFGKTARMIMIAMIISWIGYLVSDMIRGTPSGDYLRGWSRWIAMAASFATLAWLGSKNIGYLASFLIGLSVGSCISPVMLGGIPAPVVYWKFYAGVPICIIALVLVSRFSAWASIATLVGLAMLSLILDTRSVALMCLVTAAITLLAARRSAHRRMSLTPVSKASMLAGAVVMATCLLAAVFLIQYVGQKYGYTQRFQHSNSTRFASATVAWSAISDSPLIGYGSWPRDPELARQRDKLVAKYKGVPAFRVASQDNLIIAHSQILQGWLEGGILGLAFFVVLGWQLGRQLLWLTFLSPRMPLTSVIVFLQLHSAWHLVFSPFSGAQRVYIPAACVFICYIAEQMTQFERIRKAYAFSFARPQLWPANAS